MVELSAMYHKPQPYRKEKIQCQFMTLNAGKKFCEVAICETPSDAADVVHFRLRQ